MYLISLCTCYWFASFLYPNRQVFPGRARQSGGNSDEVDRLAGESLEGNSRTDWRKTIGQNYGSICPFEGAGRGISPTLQNFVQRQTANESHSGNATIFVRRIVSDFQNVTIDFIS